MSSVNYFLRDDISFEPHKYYTSIGLGEYGWVGEGEIGSGVGCVKERGGKREREGRKEREERGEERGEDSGRKRDEHVEGSDVGK